MKTFAQFDSCKQITLLEGDAVDVYLTDESYMILSLWIRPAKAYRLSPEILNI